MPTEQDVLRALSQITDPDLGRDIVSLGFIKDLSIEKGRVRFTVELTTPACPLKQKFQEQCEQAVKAVPGVESVEVTMSARQRQPKTGDQPDAFANIGAVVAVSSCKGGVGKSTVAAHLSRALVRDGYSVGLLDADVYGPSLPTLFNMHNPQLFAHGTMIVPPEVDGLKVMSLGFILGDSPAVLRGPMVSNYIQQILAQCDWGKLDYLIIDMPPGTGDIQLTIVQRVALDGAIIVTTPQALSLVDVARGILMFEKVNVPVLGMIENMTSFACDDCGKVHYPFGRSQSTLQQRFGLTTLAELPISPDIENLAGSDAGVHVDALKGLADAVHRAVGISRSGKGALPEVFPLADRVHIKWPDGFEAAISNHDLRGACPCAVCVDEHTGEALLDKKRIADDIAVEAMQQLGNYAMGFSWTDGHTTGIYSWDLLRALAENLGSEVAGPSQG
jgi:Mrp family chromosome partitioning ATPase/DUF971 family protein